MTKKEAVENHRKMWRWIAEETLKREIKVFESDYLSLLYNKQHNYECFCCEYVSQFINDACAICSITWPGGCCSDENGLYAKFTFAKSLKQRAELAYIISQLSERETSVFDIVEGDLND